MPTGNNPRRSDTRLSCESGRSGWSSRPSRPREASATASSPGWPTGSASGVESLRSWVNQDRDLVPPVFGISRTQTAWGRPAPLVIRLGLEDRIPARTLGGKDLGRR